MSSLFRAPYRGLLMALLWIFSVPLSVAAEWPAITPAEQSMTGVPEQPGAPAVILNREETDNDLLHFHTTYMRIKIFTEGGREYANVQIPYDRHGGTIGEIAGRTVHADGTVIPFEGKILDKIIVKQQNLRLQVKSFSLPDVQVGSIIEYRYSFRYPDESLIQPQWTMQQDLFQKRAFFKNTPYDFKRSNISVILGNGQLAMGLNWTSSMPKDHQPQIRTTPMAYWIDLQMDNIPAFVEEPFQQPSSTLKWHVDFYYVSHGKVEDFWKDAGKTWNKRVENFMGRKNGVPEAVAQTVTASDTPEQKVRKIYDYVAELENQSFIPTRGQQEEHALGLKSDRGAEDVLRQRSGDHDDLTRLFVAMVRAAGIPAWLMWVPDRSENFFTDQYLNTDQFEAEIAIVQLNDKDVFLDPGSKFCPYGVLDWRYTAVRGLRQSAAKGTEFADAPVTTYDKGMIQRAAYLSLTEQGALDGKVIVGFFGLEAMRRRREAARTDAEGQKKLLEDEMKRWLPGNSEVTLTKVPQWDKPEKTLIAEFQISSPYAVSAGKRWILSPHVFQINQKALFPATQRVNPIYFSYPSQQIDEVNITLPASMEVESIPADDLIKLDYAIYETRQKQEAPKTISSVRNLIMNQVGFPVTQYKTLKDFYDKVKAGDDQQVILKAAAHAAGN
jgi:hypothetical protein